jgi:hypothetical protein
MSSVRTWQKAAVEGQAGPVRSGSGISEFNLFGYFRGIIDFDFEIAQNPPRGRIAHIAKNQRKLPHPGVAMGLTLAVTGDAFINVCGCILARHEAWGLLCCR